MKKLLIRFALLNSFACCAVMMTTGCESRDSATKTAPGTETELGGAAPLDEPEAGSTTAEAGVDVPDAKPEMKKSDPALDPDGNPVESKTRT